MVIADSPELQPEGFHVIQGLDAEYNVLSFYSPSSKRLGSVRSCDERFGCGDVF